jgi:hypothetical protein
LLRVNHGARTRCSAGIVSSAAASALPLIRLEKIISVALVISYHHHVEQWTFQRILVKFLRKIDFLVRDFMISS